MSGVVLCALVVEAVANWLTGPGGVIGIAAVCVLLITWWVARTLNARTAWVTLLFSAMALTCVWIAYQVVPVEHWRSGSLWRTLVIFALPAVAATVVALVRARGHLPVRGWVFLACLWGGPALVIWISQLAPFHDLSDTSFANMMWFGASSSIVYVVIPIAFALVFRQRIRGYGLSWGTIRTEARYLLLIVPIVAVLVFFISTETRFQQVYPFYDYEHGGDGAIAKLLAFEVVYGLSFVALEFFFRGFLAIGGEQVLGAYAVPAMAFAYCLLHLGKPMPECASSLIGGLALGFIALRFRSIAVGVAAHLTMAWGMDAAVVWRTYP